MPLFSWSLALVVTVNAGIAVAVEPQPAVGVAAAVSQPRPAPVAAPAAPATVTVHPQVSMASFTREYRSRPLAVSLAGRETVAAVEKALDRRDMRLHLSETPLRDLVGRLHDELKLPVLLDVKALEDAGVDLDMPITFNQSGMSLRSALNHMLGQVGLAFTITDESLVLTTQDRAWENLDVRLYPLPWGMAAQAEPDLQPLVALVQSTVEPAAWDANGGAGAIKPVANLGEVVLVVSQTQEIHAAVEGLLRGLHERAFAEFGDAETPRAAIPVSRVHRVVDASTRAALAEKLVELCNATLGKSGDAAARVTEVGESLVVQSVSPEFHALAARMVAAIAGVTRPGATGLGMGELGGGGAAMVGGGMGF